MAYKSERDKAWYYRNRDSQIAKQKRQREERYQWLLENVGDRCEMCGSTESLEFDHLNPAHKPPGRLSCRSRGITALKEELSNLRTLCKQCHTKWSTGQKKAAWELFCELPLNQQHELVLKYVESTSL